MSILINMDEMLYSASSCNVILERKNARQLWQQDYMDYMIMAKFRGGSVTKKIRVKSLFAQNE